MDDLRSLYETFAKKHGLDALDERRTRLQHALDDQTELRERKWERYRRFMATVEKWIRPISPALFYFFVADGPSRSVDHPLLNGQIETLPRAYHDRDEAFQREVDRRRDRKVELVEALQKTDRRIERLKAHREAVIEVRDKLLLGETGADAREESEQVTQDSLTPEGWKKNAAMMHAYFSNHQVPENLGDIDEVIADDGLLDSFSHDHTWRTLKEEGWASSDGNIQALVEALERWAPHFEEEYGKEKADWAADPFNWPSSPD